MTLCVIDGSQCVCQPNEDIPCVAALDMKTEIKSLRQQLDKINHVAHCGSVDSFLALSDEDKRLWFVSSVKESTRRKEAEQQLAESQAREKVLRDALVAINEARTDAMKGDAAELLYAALAMPSDSTALDEAIKQAKREALLEAASVFDIDPSNDSLRFIARELRRMAEKLQ